MWNLGPIQTTNFHLLSVISIFIPPCHLSLGIQGTFCPSGLPPTFFMHCPFFHTCHMLRLSHPPWFHHPRNIWWEVQNSKIPRYAIISSPLLSPPPIFLSTLFSSTFNLSCFLSTTVQVSHPYKTEVKSCFCIFNFNIVRQQARRQKILTWMASDIP